MFLLLDGQPAGVAGTVLPVGTSISMRRLSTPEATNFFADRAAHSAVRHGTVDIVARYAELLGLTERSLQAVQFSTKSIVRAFGCFSVTSCANKLCFLSLDAQNVPGVVFDETCILILELLDLRQKLGPLMTALFHLLHQALVRAA